MCDVCVCVCVRVCVRVMSVFVGDVCVRVCVCGECVGISDSIGLIDPIFRGAGGVD